MKIWRYVDFPKFVSMLSRHSLYFTCVTQFQDPYEGWLPRSYIEALARMNRTYVDQAKQTQAQIVARQPLADDTLLTAAIKDLEDKLQTQRVLKEVNDKFGASCWHINEGESAAMWQLYGAAGAGIAIESTRERLEAATKDAAPHPVFIDPIRYMDFDQDPIDKSPHRHLMGFIKRKSFEHEQELRAVVMLPEPRKGTEIVCDLNILIARIHVAPLAAPYYVDALRYIVDHADPRLEAPILESRLLEPPDY